MLGSFLAGVIGIVEEQDEGLRGRFLREVDIDETKCIARCEYP
jgi:hypothetical protein